MSCCLLWQDHAFAFLSEGVRIEAPSATHPRGLVEVQGIWRNDGQRYTVQLVPVAGGAATRRGLQAHALPAGIGSRTSGCGWGGRWWHMCSWSGWQQMSPMPL